MKSIQKKCLQPARQVNWKWLPCFIDLGNWVSDLKKIQGKTEAAAPSCNPVC